MHGRQVTASLLKPSQKTEVVRFHRWEISRGVLEILVLT